MVAHQAYCAKLDKPTLIDVDFGCLDRRSSTPGDGLLEGAESQEVERCIAPSDRTRAQKGMLDTQMCHCFRKRRTNSM